MTDQRRDAQSTDDGIDRRNVLKGATAAGFAATALTGNASAGGTHDNEITFCAAGSETFEYHVEVSGELERGGKYESDDGDEVGDDWAKGAVGDERCDSFKFSGEIETVKLDGPGKVFVNGDLLKDTTEDDDLPNRIVIEAEGDRVEYKFRVSGRVRRGEFATSADEIDGNVVKGAVDGKGRDDFWYSGALAFDSTDGPLTVTLHLEEN